MKDEISGATKFGFFPSQQIATFAETAPISIGDAINLGQPPRKRTDARKTFYRSYVKRALDITVVVLSLPFWVPLVALCALALWVDGGKPFYTQHRLGAGGKRFSIFKLRSMVHNADAVLETYLARDPEMRREWDTHQKIENDPRITPLGRVLRKTSLDELPQLINVLKGDMSLVGPRPMMPNQLDLYGNPRAYNALRPGITGLWQVSARNAERFSYRNEVDAAYEQEVTLKVDVNILIKTVGVVLRPTGH